MDRATVREHVASVLARYDRPLEDVRKRLVELEVDKAESGEAGKVGYRKQKNDGTSTRVAVRVGKFVKQLFGDWPGKQTLLDQDVQDIGSEIIALLWSSDDDDSEDGEGKVRELSGEDLRHFYLKSISGINSCMCYDETQKYLDIYVDNPNRVKLATVRIGGHAARALVWTFPDGSRYMDKIYHTSDACCTALAQYAAKHGIGERGDMPCIQISMKIRNGEDSYWPYVDTLYFMSINSDKLCLLSNYSGDHCLHTTDGVLEGYGTECRNCRERMDEDDVYTGPDGESYCEGCYHERFFHCEHCDNDCELEELVETVYGTQICERCYRNHHFTCEDCGRVYPNDNSVSVNDEDTIVCIHCFEDHYFRCNVCHESCHTDQRCDGPRGTDVCENCAEQYAVCSECEEVFDKDTLVDSMCPDCAIEKMEAVAAKEETDE